MAQNTVCARHHSIDQQLCRWLLLSMDRLPGNELAITQAVIARVLGVRRDGITQAVGKLEASGVIECARRHIRIMNRAELEHRACECYTVIKNTFDRLRSYEMPDPARRKGIQMLQSV